jgi:hypothetical protein
MQKITNSATFLGPAKSPFHAREKFAQNRSKTPSFSLASALMLIDGKNTPFFGPSRRGKNRLLCAPARANFLASRRPATLFFFHRLASGAKRGHAQCDEQSEYQKHQRRVPFLHSNRQQLFSLRKKRLFFARSR